ncbi:kelch-like protein 5 isoform X1 [Anopheles arabiensis]|uniref:kelch-like protein 5 isoform X1 n=2 Tax=Anopheles arabiensis TaxID=7173 RepID=UPI001AAD5986|nr:kelch-like protein 5 isoform X1 [Anopheles arabiensis]XP_040241408.2 kelch-like protein 5 isoform X1 [Anopheles coluzzii]
MSNELSCKGSPTSSASVRASLVTDESHFSLASLNSSVSQDEFFRCRDHSDVVLKRMQDYLQSEKLCDVVLIAGVDGRRIPAHRLVLSASSAYFSAMFTGQLRESQQEEITLQEVSGDALNSLIQYCYTGAIEIREDTVETLLATACLLQLSTIVGACCNFLARQLHPSNCLGFSLFAEQQGCTALLKLATAYTCQHFQQVWKNQEFFMLDAAQLANLLRSDDLNVPNEQEVFHALMAWIQYDAEGRKRHIPELLALIKLPLLQPSFIVDHVEALCGGANECQQLVMEAFKWHLIPGRRSLISTSRTRPRKSTMGRLLAVGGMDGHKGAISIESYDPRLDKWTLLKNMPTRRLQFGVAVLEDKLIIVGGRDGLKTLNTVDSFDLNTMCWSTLVPPMGTPRHGLGVAFLEGPLYAVGGHDGWSYLNTVERWDPSARTWSYVAPMSAMRSTAGVAVLGGRLYVIGGRDGSVCHRTVECYDPHTNKWTLRAPMNQRRGCVGVGVLNGFLYALGGHDCPPSNPAVCRTDTVERYDPTTDTWTLIASLSVGRDAIGVSVLGDWLVALGGYDGIQYLKIVEQYDAETNEWTPIAPVNYSRAGACVVAIPNSFSNPASTTGGVALPSTSAANPSSPNNAIAASSSSSAVNVPVANNSTTGWRGSTSASNYYYRRHFRICDYYV